jgi:hypothetical protein
MTVLADLDKKLWLACPAVSRVRSKFRVGSTTFRGVISIFFLRERARAFSSRLFNNNLLLAVRGLSSSKPRTPRRPQVSRLCA